MKKYIVIIVILFLVISFTLPGCVNKTAGTNAIVTGTTIENTTHETISETTETTPNTTASQSSSSETGDLKVYNGSSFGFEYPKIISLSQQGEKILLTHSINYQHPDPCDFKGDAPQLDKLTDFNVSLVVSNKNLKDTIDANESSDMIKNSFKGDTVELSPGVIDSFNAGSLTGYRITAGIEGCGMYTYYFSIAQDKTLAVTRSFISEFLPINADSKKYLSLPGIITPAQEEEFFNKILASFKSTS